MPCQLHNGLKTESLPALQAPNAIPQITHIAGFSLRNAPFASPAALPSLQSPPPPGLLQQSEGA